ncbi:MAG: hypothetical protein KC996_10590 [Phycisphaerales bacterium]|nr:hypothetical protein [Phycisphaerales bacterium]
MRTILAVGVVSSLLAVGGCVSYTNVSGPESPPSFHNPNHYAAVDVTAKSLDWVLTRHGPSDGSGYVVNFPAGTSQQSAMEIFAKLPGGAVWPTSTDQNPLGMYHVGRVWIRASEAKVDVVYPFTMLNGGTGQRGVTVWLQGGVRDWRVIRGQYWSPGTVVVPEVSVPVVEEEGFFDRWTGSDSGDTEPAQSEPEPETDVISGVSPWVEPEQEPEPVPQPAPSETGNGSALWREVPVGDS